jgi:hypothetical protein
MVTPLLHATFHPLPAARASSSVREALVQLTLKRPVPVGGLVKNLQAAAGSTMTIEVVGAYVGSEEYGG